MTARAHGACTGMPYGECSTTRQSPSSSRKRSTTSVVSVGTCPVAVLLLGEEGEEVVGGALVEADGGEALAVAESSLSRSSRRRRDPQPRARAERPDRLPEFRRPPEPVALPERHLAGLAERGAHEHLVVRDLLDAPARRAEREHVAHARLVDHLLVELADAAARTARRRRPADHEHAEQPAVGDRAAGRHGEPLRAGPARDRAGHAIPDDAAAAARRTRRSGTARASRSRVAS